MTPTPAPHPPVTPPRRRRVPRRSLALALIGGLTSTALLTACAEFGIGLPRGESTGADGTRAATSTPPQRDAERPAPASGSVSQEQAAAAALAAVGSGTVTWIGPEDDRGARWEVEVTRPDGTEVDVLVAANGTIIALIDKPGER